MPYLNNPFGTAPDASAVYFFAAGVTSIATASVYVAST
jgi:hypothetical protein